MIGKPRLRYKALAPACALLWMLPSIGAQAQAPKPAFKPGTVILYCQPGTSQADVTALASLINATAINSLLLPDCYQLVLPANEQAEADTLNAVATLKVDPRVRFVGPNRLWHNYGRRQNTGRPTIKPNDPLYNQQLQWGLDLINMPAAWLLQKGSANVAVLDSGFDNTHEDLMGQNLADSQNFTVTPPSAAFQPPGAGPELQHGVHVSGIIIANTNNSKGVASICGWGTSKVLFCRTGDDTADNPISAIIAALAYCTANKTQDHLVALNMSFGGPGDPTDVTDPVYVATLGAYTAGIVPCAAAGNDNDDDTQQTPSAYPFCISVAATDRTGHKSVYSSFGKVEIAAPGGAGLFNGTDVGGFGPDDILSTRDSGYHYEAGTSMACPHVTGVCGLLLSVPTVTARQVYDYTNKNISLLLSNANHTITGQSSIPDTNYGYGLLDAYAALLKVSFTASILSPIGINPATGLSTDPSGLAPQPLATQRPTLQFQVGNIPLANVNISLINGSTTVALVTNGVPNATLVAQGLLTGFSTNGVTSGSNPLFTISFRYRFDFTDPSAQETVQITAQPTDTTVAAVTDTRTFTIAPHVFYAGLSMISVPVFETATDSPTGALRDAKTILSAPDAVLYRWVATSAQYAVDGSSSDYLPALASLHPTDVTTSAVSQTATVTTGSSTITAPDPNIPDSTPAGLGYFLKITNGSPFKSYGSELNQQLAQVPVHEGWNMIGDPFIFSVPFNSIQVETSDGNRQSIQDATTNKLILPFLYSYTGSDYVFNQLPAGQLDPWSGYWIYVVPKSADSLNTANTLTLIIPPTGSTSATVAGRATKVRAAGSRATNVARVTGPGSWLLQLEAHSSGLTDAHNYIGVSATATDGDDNTKAPKPPKMSPYVSVGMVRSTGTLYAQDLRALTGTKTWTVLVSTDRPNANISLNWPTVSSVPRNVKLTLTDSVTGQTYDMRGNSAYQIHTDATHQTHLFTITAEPGAASGRTLITGLFVNPNGSGRGAGASLYEINYTLSRDASVEITIKNSSGREIGTAQSSRAASAGANKSVWNGLNNAGRTLAAGLYIVQVRAVTSDGEVTRETYPLTLTGR